MAPGPSDAPAAAHRKMRWTPASVVAIVVPAVALAIAGWLRRWTTDDAFINYRIVDQLMAGNGPVFNAGERVEASTSTLWLALLAVGNLLLPLRIEHVAIALSLPLSALGLVAMSVAARRLLAPADADGDPGGAPPNGTAAGSGLRGRADRRGGRMPGQLDPLVRPSKHRHVREGAASSMRPGSHLSARLLSGRVLWVPAGSLMLVALPPMWDFATAGLETGLTLAWTGLLALGLATVVDPHPSARPLSAEPAPRWVFVVAGLGPLVRPDCAVPAAAVLAYALVRSWRTTGWRPTLGRLAVAAAIPVAYQLFRMAYYAALVPNTALAKQAGFAHWTEGWAYLGDFAGPYTLWLPLLLMALAAASAVGRLPRPRRLAVAVLPLAGLAHAVVIIRAGGDYAHARLLLPPLFAIVAPFAVLPVPLLRAPAGASAPNLRRFGGVTLVPLLALVVWAVMCAGLWRKGEATLVRRTLIADGRQASVGPLGVDHPVTAEEQGWGRRSVKARRIRAARITVGNRVLDVEPADGLDTPMVAIHGVGVSGYSVGPDVYVMDQLGLGDPITSRFALDRVGFIGHEKPQPEAWLAARLSDVPGPRPQLGNPGFATPIYLSPSGRFLDDVVAARRTLRCPPLRRLRAATTQPLTAGRALSNVWRSPGLTSLRIDPDPRRARADLC